MKRYIRSAISSFDDLDWREQVALASNPNASIRDLIKWGNSDSVDVRLAVARNPNTPEDFLWQLWMGPDYRTHIALSVNPSAPVDLLIALAKDSCDIACKYALQNPNATDEVFYTAAANCRDLNVAGEILDNKNTPVEALRALLNTSLAQRSQWVRDSCRKLIAEKEQNA